MKRALLVIDMQKGSFSEATPRYDARGVVERINLIASAFRAYGEPVIFIQHDGTAQGEFSKDSREWQLLDELEIQPHDHLVSKTAQDAFYSTNLESLLSNLSIEHLVITGCATDFCVESTIQAALSRDFRVTVVADGHTTADRPHAKAKTLIDHYNWVWSEMIPTTGRVVVRSSTDILKEVVAGLA